jgi:anaerobic magnesium-protoporphyrin IX monomethyl ester cyclase
MTNSDTCDILLIGCEEEENLGLRSIAAFLARHQIRVAIEPLHWSLKERILRRILQGTPRIIGISLIFQEMLFEFADLITYLRQNGVSAHITMGGHFPTLEPHGTLKTIPELDTIVRHEGEYTLLELFHHVDQPDYWEHIKGIVYRDNGTVRINPPRPLIQDLDSLPYPLRSDRPRTHRGLGMCSALTSRGCYSDCSFCSIQQFYREAPGPRRRSRSPCHVAGEMEHLFFNHGIRIFIFKDDDLCTRGRKQRQWIEDFALELKKRGIADQILWRISCRVDEVDTEIVEILKDVGLACLYLGIESGSNRGLKTFNKHYTVNDIHRALDILSKVGMSYEFGFMLFDPDTTMTSMMENISFLKEIGKDGKVVAHFTKMFPYAGTPIARRLKKEGRLKGDIASPDYAYADPRLDLLQSFFSQVFHFRNFHVNGLVNLLQLAKFDTAVLAKFSDRQDTPQYKQAVQDLTRQCNESALETMSLAVRFMKERDYGEILQTWQILQYFGQKEVETQRQITEALHRLMGYYGFDPTEPSYRIYTESDMCR